VTARAESEREVDHREAAAGDEDRGARVEPVRRAGIERVFPPPAGASGNGDRRPRGGRAERKGRPVDRQRVASPEAQREAAVPGGHVAHVVGDVLEDDARRGASLGLFQALREVVAPQGARGEGVPGERRPGNLDDSHWVKSSGSSGLALMREAGT